MFTFLSLSLSLSLSPSLSLLYLLSHENDIEFRLFQVGDRIKRPRLAETLKLIAINGPDIFYNGNMTDNLVKEIRAFKGIIKREDFVNYKYA